MNYKEFYFYLKGILANNTSLSKKQVDSLREEMEKVVGIDITQPLKDLDWKIPSGPIIRCGGTTGDSLQPRNAVVSDDYKCTHGYTNFDQ